MSALPELPRSIREVDDRAARDLNRLARICERNRLDALPELTAQDSRIRTGAPEPLRRPVPPPEPYPIVELGPILRPACDAIRRVIQAPDAICGASLLAAASLAVQALANVEIDGRIIPLTLWLVSVAESGERKSACDGEAMRPAREHEKALSKAYADAMASFEAEMEEWEAKRDYGKSQTKKTKGEGTAKALRDIGPAPMPPLRPTLLAADFTAEGLAKLLANGLPSIGAFTDEAALVFGGHGMTKESTARTAATLCKLWDSGTLDRIRSAEGAIKLYGRRLALHLMAQPVIAERAMSDDVLSGQGFLARCLLAWPQSTAGTRAYRAESLRDDPAIIQYNATLAARHALPLPIAEGARNELAPQEGKSREALIADAATSPHLSSALVVGYFSKSLVGEQSLTDVCNSLSDQAARVKSGDLSHLESMLSAQAVSLNTLFAALAQRAAMNFGEHIDATETYLKLALRAQTQCRATIETLAEIKNPPVVFARQANIAQGPQQVNNYHDTARADQIEKPQNELLGHDHGERLDARTKAAAIRGNQEVATVETVIRTKNRARKVRSKSK